MYGWIDLADVMREDQVEALSNIGQMLKSQDRESQKLAIDLLIASDFDNIKKSSVDCGSLIIHYSIFNKSFMVIRSYSSQNQIYTLGYLLKVIKSIIDDKHMYYLWSDDEVLKSSFANLISCLVLTINRACDKICQK